MKMEFQAFLTYMLRIFNLLTASPFDQFDDVSRGLNQAPLPNPLLSGQPHSETKGYPIFDPPNGPERGSFICSYPSLEDYEPCFEDDKACWLRPKDPESGLPRYDIDTNYENIFPQGITRKYYLTIENGTLFPDGCEHTEGKLINNTYPGPWIEACWGDDIEVTVTNFLPCNGTTVHWHGLRQLDNAENDGVNAVTQCPIAPGDSYTYKFKALQYGTSWYHSHYSLQVCYSKFLFIDILLSLRLTISS